MQPPTMASPATDAAAPTADLATRETVSLIAADKVDGSEVRNRAGDSLGVIERIMLDKRSGKVAYAVMRFGGFLGLGAERHPLPWSLLDYDPELGGYVLDLTKEQLAAAPAIDGRLDGEFDDRTWREPVYSHYGSAPYWS